jgi:hypothetical protein
MIAIPERMPQLSEKRAAGSGQRAITPIEDEPIDDLHGGV